MTEQDEWARGIIYGLCHVQDLYGNYPTVCAPFIRLALKVIRQHRLDVHPNALEFARRWLKEVERQPTRIDKLLCELENARLNPAQWTRLAQMASHHVDTTLTRNGHQRRTAPDAGTRTRVRVRRVRNN